MENLHKRVKVAKIKMKKRTVKRKNKMANKWKKIKTMIHK